mmetsp:Transcript_15544/g.60803  ORF Transcript_15544/g.60803 Transcript_15544/m.60803 type:complete len:535 (-) Transcript_15544:38-1642(-)
MAQFVIAEDAIADNATGWGPTGVPEEFANLPYQPFGKGDRLGKAADWIGGYGNQYHSQPKRPDEDFTMVVSQQKPKQQKPRHVRRMQNASYNRNRHANKDQGYQRKGRTQMSRHRNRRYQSWRNRFHRNYYEKRILEPSVQVKPDWEPLEQIDLSTLLKLSHDPVEGETLVECGELNYFDKTFASVAMKHNMRLVATNDEEEPYFNVTTSDDPIIRQLATEDKGNVFCTDALLAMLVSAPRSVYSWDIVVHRVGSKLFLDKRDNGAEMLTVYETAPDSPDPENKDTYNRPSELSQEATLANQRFIQQVQRSDMDSLKFDVENPEEFETQYPVAYRYRRFKLGNISLVARCEVDAVRMTSKKQNLFLTVKALNEYHYEKNPRDKNQSKLGVVDWRLKLESQRGAVVATELKNNSNKLCRWASQALIAGTDQFILGFISRAHPRDNHNHVILGTQQYFPEEFAGQINVRPSNMWGIIKTLVDLFMGLPEGKYLMLKDPEKLLATLYRVPQDAFDEDNGDDEEDGEDEDYEDDDLDH